MASSNIVVPVYVAALEAFVLEEEEPMAARRYLEVQFKKGVGEQQSIPSLAHTSSSKKGRWWKKGDDTVEQPVWELTPYPTIHPWTRTGCVDIFSNATMSTTSSIEGVGEGKGDSRMKSFHLFVYDDKGLQVNLA